MSTTITLDHVTKRFGSTVAVDDVCLTIQPGELFFLLGPSGCGKTTLLRAIAGFSPPSRGIIRFDDRDVTKSPPNKRNTGMVFQSYALWPHMSVEQNVAFGLKTRKTAASEITKRVADALAMVGLAGLARRKPNELSGGQQQRVALARALVVRPDVLLLDEPLSNLDAKLRVELRKEIRRVCKQSGITTVYVTHDQSEALSMADRIAVMRDGQVVQVGPPAELYRMPRSLFVAEFLGETNFLQGSIARQETDALVIETKAGQFRSSHPSASEDPNLVPGRAVTCSIRPEAFSIAAEEPGDGATNVVRAKPSEIIYLGDTAQFTIDTESGVTLHISQLNPSDTAQTTLNPLRSGERVYASVEPKDVVILPDRE